MQNSTEAGQALWVLRTAKPEGQITCCRAGQFRSWSHAIWLRFVSLITACETLGTLLLETPQFCLSANGDKMAGRITTEIAVATSCLAAAAGTLLPSGVLTSAELVPGNCGFQDHMVELAGRGDTGVILPGPGVSPDRAAVSENPDTRLQ